MNKYLKIVTILSLIAYKFAFSMNNKLITSSPNPLAMAYTKKTLAMQKNLFHDQEITGDTIKIIFPDYQKLVIKKEAAEKFDFLRGALDFDSNKPNKRIIKLPKNVPACLTKQNVEQIIRQDRDSIPKETIVAVFNAADFLGAEEKLFYPIAEAYVTKFQKSEYGPEYQDIKRFLGIKHFYASGNALIFNALGLFPLKECSSVVEKIHSLDDLTQTNEQQMFSREIREKIKSIYLTNHCIDSFDVEKIIRAFPNLSRLDLRHNKINILSIENLSHLPNGFYLDLRDNPISSIKKDIIKNYPNNCTINLTRTEQDSLNKQLENIANSLNRSNSYIKYFYMYIGASILNTVIGTTLVDDITNSRFISAAYTLASGIGLLYKAFQVAKEIIDLDRKNNNIKLYPK